MSNLFESLESRTFFSVSPAVATLHTDEAAVKTALKALKIESTAAIKTITADFKAAGLQVTDKGQVKALSTALKAIGVADGKAIGAATSKVNSDVSKLLAAEAQLAKKPTSAKLMTKVATDKTALMTDAAAQLSAIGAANQGNAVIAALDAIVADGGTPGADASSAITSLSNDAATMKTAASQAFSTDVTTILAL